MTKKDKRSRKTVRAIQDTLLRLLCTKRLREIRIVDLCTEADINRTTFYLHFCGLGDVLGSLRKEIVDEIFERSEGDLISFDMPRNPLPFLTECTEVLRSYDALGNFVRLSADADAFLAKLKDEFCNRLLDSYIAAGGRAGRRSDAHHTFSDGGRARQLHPMAENGQGGTLRRSARHLHARWSRRGRNSLPA